MEHVARPAFPGQSTVRVVAAALAALFAGLVIDPSMPHGRAPCHRLVLGPPAGDIGRATAAAPDCRFVLGFKALDCRFVLGFMP